VSAALTLLFTKSFSPALPIETRSQPVPREAQTPRAVSQSMSVLSLR
jgi:hypothetical protein